jgi:hypothetical protein
VREPTDRPTMVFLGCTLAALGTIAWLWHLLSGTGEGGFLVWLLSPLAGFGILASRFRRHVSFTLMMAVASGIYLIPWFMLAFSGDLGQSGWAFGVVLLGWMGLAWLGVVGVGFVGWLTLPRAPEERSGVNGAPSVPQASADSSDGHNAAHPSDGDGDDAGDSTWPRMSGPYIRTR